MRHLVILIATGCYTGLFKIVPGTVGTIPAWLIGYFALGSRHNLLIAATVATFFVSVWAAGAAEKYLGHDSKKIVIDEWAGMFIAFLFVPFSLVSYIIAFFAFRVFDVIKIWPAGRLEKAPRGWGVTLDDVAAGIQANIITQLIVRLLDLT